MDKDKTQNLFTVLGVMCALMGLWHTIVIKPMQDNSKDLKASAAASHADLRNDLNLVQARVQGLALDNVELAVTLKNLRSTLEKIDAKLEKDN